jgi:MFS family permease
VAAASPPGRSSTAQGIYGASGTIGFVVASLVSGVLAADDIRYPFWVFAAVMLVCLVAGLIVGGHALRSMGASPAESGVPATADAR